MFTKLYDEIEGRKVELNRDDVMRKLILSYVDYVHEAETAPRKADQGLYRVLSTIYLNVAIGLGEFVIANGEITVKVSIRENVKMRNKYMDMYTLDWSGNHLEFEYQYFNYRINGDRFDKYFYSFTGMLWNMAKDICTILEYDEIEYLEDDVDNFDAFGLD